jgi:hypothetical protein
MLEMGSDGEEGRGEGEKVSVVMHYQYLGWWWWWCVVVGVPREGA